MLTDVNVLSFSVLNDPTSEHMLNEECLQMFHIINPISSINVPSILLVLSAYYQQASFLFYGVVQITITKKRNK